jgi:flagellar motor component MotA
MPGAAAIRSTMPMRVRSAHTREMKKDLWSRQRTILVGLGLIGAVLGLTWVVLYLNAGATSAP